MSNQFMDASACSGLSAGSLFYPSAGTDTELPINTFVSWIRDFWFVDIGYDLSRRFTNAHQLEDEWSETLSGTTLRKAEPFEVNVRHERYKWSEDGKVITIHRCRGRGYDAFRTLFAIPGRQVSVFFYRGDSQGESGSGFYWLRRQRLGNVLNSLEPGGLVVSDGSNAMRPLKTSASDIDSGRQPLPRHIAGRRFVCVGHLGPHRARRPTLVWKVSEATE